jgi:hypothetical protein
MDRIEWEISAAVQNRNSAEYYFCIDKTHALAGKALKSFG